MSLSSMITGAGIALGAANTLFKNPAQAGMDSHAVNQSGMTVLSHSITLADPSFNPSSIFTQLTNSLSGITSAISSKISNIGTELSICTAASKAQSNTLAVDAIVSKNLSGIPNQITQAFPPPDTVSPAFASITSSNSIVTSGADEIASHFDNTGAISALYTALNSIPGVNVSNGKQLLALLANSPSATVISTVNTTVATDASLRTALKSSFTSVGTSTTTMTNNFDSVVSSSQAAVNSALSFVTGANVVNMINNTNPSISNVMSSIIDTSKVDQKALSVSAAVNDKTLILPGKESVNISNSNANLTADTSAGAAINAGTLVSPPPGTPSTVDYTSSELANFKDMVDAQRLVSNAATEAAAAWLKPNVEDWKAEVQYDAKKKAAGYTKENPYGTSTDPVALAEWKTVYDAFIPKRDYYNNTLVVNSKVNKEKHEEMILEYKRRMIFGKYPYTYMASQGTIVQNQTTWLDSTK